MFAKSARSHGYEVTIPAPVSDNREAEGDGDAWSIPSSPRNPSGSHKGSEFSLEYLPNPMEVIEELNHIRVRFTFEDEKDQRKKRANLLNRFSHDSSSDNGSNEYLVGSRMPLPSIPNERQTIQNELLARLEALNGLDATYIKSIPDDGRPRLGIYTQEERVDRINAYREKRKKRVFGKVRYVLRKRASEGRARVKGRFAKEDPNSPASTAPPATNNQQQTMEEMTAENLKDSTSWLEKMTIGAARRLSFSSTARKRNSLPARKASSFTYDEEEAADKKKEGSWSSWLLKSRRKSETSGNSGRFSDQAPPPMQISPSHFMHEQEDNGEVFFVENLEPDRKRLTSGSSALFNDITFDPTVMEGDAS